MWVVNAAHMKAVPGRKTDVKDSEWLAQLLQHGLLKASFIPPVPQRELRELTRYRSALVADRAQLINRLQKVLEDANVKLASVATDITGVSGRDILSSLAKGEEDVEVLAQLARGKLRNRLSELKQALQGRVKAHHRFMLTKLLEQLEFYDEQIAAFNQEIVQRLEGSSPTPQPPEGERLSDKAEDQSELQTKQLQTTQAKDRTKLAVVKGLTQPTQAQLSQHEQALEWLDTIPGINRRIGEIILAEIGLEMNRFPSAGHLASWAGLCPGHNESGGKRRSGKTTKGSRWLRQALIEAAQAAMHTRDTYLSAQGRRLTARLGRKKAVVAVAHSILVIIYHVLSRGEEYKELGGDYFSKLDQESVKRRALRQLASLGYRVELEKAS